jgi:hypothetical protein
MPVKSNQFSYDRQILSFAEGGNGSEYLRCGWSQAEDWGVWSNGPIAKVQLTDTALAGKENVALVIEARGFVTHGQPTQRVRVRVNGVDAGELLLGSDITSRSLQVPAAALKLSLFQIELVPETPMSPATTGTSSDQRLLGVGLKSLQIKEHDYLQARGASSRPPDRAGRTARKTTSPWHWRSRWFSWRKQGHGRVNINQF